MTTFNVKSLSAKVTNYMGEESYTLTPKARLVNIAATMMLGEPSYYESADKQVVALFNACDATRDPEFCLKVAKYARQKLNLRSTPIAIMVKVANMHLAKGTGLVPRYAPAIIQRADELNETFAIQTALFGRIIPNSLKKGVARAFHNFDEYQLTKWRQDKRNFNLRKTVIIAHPVPTSREQSDLYRRILNDDASPAMTWKYLIAEKGNTAAVWDELIASKKMGYMATLQELVPMIRAGATRMDDVIAYIENGSAIAKSKLLPHRFLSAYESVGSMPYTFEKDKRTIVRVREAIECAIKTATANIPRIPGTTVILCDNSGSARGDAGGKSKISSKSVRTIADMGNLLGLYAWYASENPMLAVFGDKLIPVTIAKNDGVLGNFEKVNAAGGSVGPATEHGVFVMLHDMVEKKIFADRVIVISDLQIGDGNHREYGLTGYKAYGTIPGMVDQYRKTVNPNFWYYSVSIKGYGNDVVMGPKKALISGWSEHVLSFINNVEADSMAQIADIEDMSQ